MAIDLEGGGAQQAATRPAAAKGVGPRLAPRRRRITARERMLFTERLAMLLETGMALHAALKTLHDQTDNPRLAGIVAAVGDQVLEGKPFSVALAGHPELFSPAYVGLVEAAEQGGFMFEVLQQIVELEDRQQKLNSAVLSAMAYPGFLAAFSVAVIAFVLVGVFPKFAEMFASIGDDLPATTRLLMAASDLLRERGVLLLAGGGAALVAALRWARTPRGAEAIDAAKLRVPVVRDVFLQVYMAQTMRVMGMSLANGVSVLVTLSACRDTVRNRRFRAFLLRIEEHVLQGRGFASAFANETMLPSMVREMIGTGEQTGRLAMVMSRIADFYERELMRRITAISKLAEPVMLLAVGGVVGLVVISLILPIFKLSKGVS